MSREWRQVVGFEGLYEVSNDGKVRSITRDRECGITGVHHYEGRELTLSHDAYGYLQCALSNCRKTKKAKVHRLVAEAFISPVEGKTHVNHINGDKTDNRVENLEWCDIAENNRHAYEMGLSHGVPREATLRGAEKSVKKRRRAVIRSDGQRFESAAAASRALGVSSCMVAKAIRGSNGAHTVKGFTFRWEDEDV